MTIDPKISAKAPIRHDWTQEEIEALFALPLLELAHRAQGVHRQYHDDTIQLASLLSIKTGGCAEDCGYCPQSAHHAKATGQVKETMFDVEDVLFRARIAKEAGASRFCMGAAWRSAPDNKQFDAVVEMVKGVRGMGMEACVTLGMLQPHQAQKLAQAGLTAYNHNLDTSPEFYGEIVSTRTYQDRLDTLNHVRAAGIEICCGGIIGMGEKEYDRASLLRVLSAMNPHPESVPVNALVAVRGTPMEGKPPVDAFDMVRMIAVARIVMPKSRVRLSAGRAEMSAEAQAMCFMAGANSIFYGEKLLTTANNDAKADRALIDRLGLKVREIQERNAHYGLSQ